MEMSTQNVMNTVHFGGAPLETRYHIEKGHIAGVQGHELAPTCDITAL